MRTMVIENRIIKQNLLKNYSNNIIITQVRK